MNVVVARTLTALLPQISIFILKLKYKAWNTFGFEHCEQMKHELSQKKLFTGLSRSLSCLTCIRSLVSPL